MTEKINKSELLQQLEIDENHFMNLIGAAGINSKKRSFAPKDVQIIQRGRDLMASGEVCTYEDLSNYFKEHGIEGSQEEEMTYQKAIIQQGFEAGDVNAALFTASMKKKTVANIQNYLLSGRFKEELSKELGIVTDIKKDWGKTEALIEAEILRTSSANQTQDLLISPSEDS